MAGPVEELGPNGLEIITVALDTEGPDAARPFVERAAPTHPSLLDPSHQLDAHLGVVNVPSDVRLVGADRYYEPSQL